MEGQEVDMLSCPTPIGGSSPRQRRLMVRLQQETDRPLQCAVQDCVKGSSKSAQTDFT